MDRAVYVGNRGFATTSVDATPPPAGSVTINVAYTGICGTDLHVYRGHMDGRVRPPTVIGHEMSGSIAAVGDEVHGFSVGDPVTVMPLDWCERCPACLAGNWHVCQNLRFIGLDAPGAMQQQWVVPARTLVRLPSDLPLDHAALTEPTAVAVHDVRRAGVVSGEKVAVVGAGPVGLLIAVVAREAGGDVLVVEPNEFRRRLAERFGFAVLDPQDSDGREYIDGWTGAAGADVTFEVSGTEAGLDFAVQALRVRGRLCLVAIHSHRPAIDLHRFFWRELSLVGARLYDYGDFERAIQLLSSGVVPAVELVSQVVRLDEVAAGFETLERGGPVMKVLVDCGSTR